MDDMMLRKLDGTEAFDNKKWGAGPFPDYPYNEENNWIKIQCEGNKKYWDTNPNFDTKVKYHYIRTEPHIIKFGIKAVIKDVRGNLIGIPCVDFPNAERFDDGSDSYIFSRTMVDDFKNFFYDILNRGYKKSHRCPLCFKQGEFNVIESHLYCYYCGKKVNLQNYYIKGEKSEVGEYDKIGFAFHADLYCNNCAEQIIEDDNPLPPFFQSFFDFNNNGIRHIVDGEEVAKFMKPKRKYIAQKRKRRIGYPPHRSPTWWIGKRIIRPPGF